MTTPRLLVLALLVAAPLAAQQQPAAAPPQAPRPRRSADSSIDTAIAAIRYNREVYNYQGGPRDPFASLVTEAATQTTFADLRLVSVLFDARGGRSIAVVRDKNTDSPHRLRVGQMLGRMRVIQIRAHEVVFQVEEFGFERQETLTLQRPGVTP